MSFTFSQCSDAQDNAVDVTDAEFQDMSVYCHGYEEENVIQEYFHTLGNEIGLSPPTHWRQALAMYHNLCEIARN